MNYLPQEIVLDILSRLPVIPILQFKLICKGWLHTAQIPLLASMHFANTGKDDPCLILNCENPSRQQLYSSELSSREEENQKSTEDFIAFIGVLGYVVHAACLSPLDIEDEQLRAVPRLEGKGLFRCNFDLVNLRGCFDVGVPCNNGTYNIWVTKDYEVKESWIKEYSIEIQYGYKSPVSYNPRNGTFKDLLFLRKPNRFEEYVHQGTLSRIKNLTDT
ncbi:hypothetical protein WN943_011198 [Citrus x changshan-huyou]